MICTITTMIGATELLLVAGVALLLFGGKKLPEMMKGMGQGVKNFKDAMNAPSQPQKEEEPADKSDEEKEEAQS